MRNCTNETANVVRRTRMRINVWEMKMPGQIKMFAGCLRVKLSDIGETNGMPGLNNNQDEWFILLPPKHKYICFAWSRLRPCVTESRAQVTSSQADPGHFSRCSHPFLSPLSHFPSLCVFVFVSDPSSCRGGELLRLAEVIFLSYQCM